MRGLLRETKRLEGCIKQKDRINKRLGDIAITKNLKEKLKEIIIRDTVIVKEKTNFWGKG
jgi:hypothetical protein